MRALPLPLLLILAPACHPGGETTLPKDSILVHESIPGEIDGDGDGYSEDEDCNDLDPQSYPGASEICDGIDQNCDGQTDEGTLLIFYEDIDGDGYGNPARPLSSCEPAPGQVSDNTDCDDTTQLRAPGNSESCDGIDNDCDDLIDNNVLLTWYEDNDEDGFGNPLQSYQSCEAPAGFVADNTDCDDQNPVRFPGNLEVCDSKDNDCNNQIDDGVLLSFYLDGDEDGYGGFFISEACEAPPGYLSISGDCDDADANANPGHDEVCDNIDNNCDGSIDEDSAVDAPTWYADSDIDSYGDPSVTLVQCTQPAGYVGNLLDCDDLRNDINPARLEYCNGVDDDCDGSVDEDDAVDASTWYRDADYDLYGDARSSVRACYLPANYTADNTDCNDANATAYPGATEICDGIDNSCDGNIDENASNASLWYADADADGSGDPNVSLYACTQPAAFTRDPTDCDDHNAAAYPGAPEHCDGFDNDCDGQTDEDASLESILYYADVDGDGYGDNNSTRYACSPPANYSSDRTDCNDQDSSIHPNAAEVCDGADQDCDYNIDENAIDASTWSVDLDADGFGNPILATVSCTQPAGYLADASDCDDLDPLIYPGATEICDGSDDNCDGFDDTLGYWPFDDASGSTASDSGPYGLDGTITDGTWTTGRYNGGIDFNGTTAYVTMPYSELVPTTGMTLSAWVRPDSLHSSAWDSVLSMGAMGTGSLGCCRDTYFLGYFLQRGILYTDTASANSSIMSSNSWSSHISNWHHLLATWDASGERQLYVDGALVSSDISGPSSLTWDGAPFRVGADSNSGASTLFFDGRIDEVKVFECAVDSTQAYRDYAANWPF